MVWIPPGKFIMLGNVWEWCQDREGKYPSETVTDPTGPSSGNRWVLRGFSLSCRAGQCCSAGRCYRDPSNVRDDLGFRLARD
jgi:formylglycine-generating enzyme required for sulfatase activity